MTRAKDISKIVSDANFGGTLDVAGVFTGSSLDISGDIDVDGTTNLDIVDIDGAVDIATTLAVAGNTTVGGTLGVTGVLTGTSLDISGDIDVDGTTNLDVVDIDGAVDFASTTAHAGNATFADNAKAIFGAGSDLQIYHDGSNSIISDQGAGSLILRGTAGVYIQDAAGNENLLGATADGAVTLYYDDAAKLATTSTGIDVTGITVSDGMSTNTSGTSNFIAGVNAGNSIVSGGNYNTVVGDEAGTAITTGDYNTALGFQALKTTTTGQQNVAIGRDALRDNTDGQYNVSLGTNALRVSSTGDSNTAIGHQALTANTTASNNTAVGFQALVANTEGTNNVALGDKALTADTLGSRNTAIGVGTLDAQNFTGATNSNNTALGYAAGSAVSTGIDNTLLGARAGMVLSDADYNVAVGMGALTADTKGNRTTAVGTGALKVQNFTSVTNSDNVAVGYDAGRAIQTALKQTIMGNFAGKTQTTGDLNTYIGYDSGSLMTTGAKNTILGAYNGNGGGLDIRTSSNNIVLSDGDGSPRVMVNANGYFHASQNVADSQHYNSLNFSSISSSNTQPALFVENSGDGNVYGMIIDFTDSTPDNNTSYFFGCQDNTAIRLKIWGDGDVQNHDNSYSGLSDVKLKEQITDASSQWDDIKSLTIRKYKMKTDVATGDSDAHWRLGVVAQEVETAGMNGLVRDNPDLITNSDGELEESGTTTKSVKYSILYMKAVKALQEAMTRIETLETRVATLEG